MVQINSISTSLIIILIFWNINECLSLSETETRKKSEAIFSSNPTSNISLPNAEVDNKENISLISKNPPESILPESSYDNFQIPESVKSFYYVFMGFAAAAIVFLIYKAYVLRRNRAERRYGVLGDRNGQELTPLGIDDDSDNDQTLFEINHQRS